MNAYIPENINFNFSKHRDRFYFIITFIVFGRMFDKRKNSESFVELSSMFLKRIIGGRYKAYIKDLINNKIIETDNQYFVRQKFKAYRLNESYRKVRLKQVQISDEKILTNYHTYKQNTKPVITPFSYLYQCLTQTQIDYENAKYFAISKITDFDEYISCNCSIDMIQAKDWFFVVDSTAGRVHHNITNLSKKIRPFLRYNNQPLVELDVRNAQPLLFNFLISNYLEGEKCTISKFLPYVHPLDIQIFKKLTEEGKFYNYLMDELDIKEDRDEFKIRFFSKVFYSRENANYVPEERKKFRKLFPNVANIISYYKKDDYRDLAVQLQKIEADIMIKKVIPGLERKKIFVLTIHDSVLVQPEMVEAVKNIILNEFQKFDLRPTLKIKNLNNENEV
jgi:hypothetical protein